VGFEEVYICEPAGNGFVIRLRAPVLASPAFHQSVQTGRRRMGVVESPAHVMVELGGDTWSMPQIESCNRGWIFRYPKEGAPGALVEVVERVREKCEGASSSC